MTNIAAATKELGLALKAGEASEGAIVKAVQAITFLACINAGNEMTEGTWDAKKSTASSKPFTMVVKRLILEGRRVYRDSEASFSEHVKGKQGEERIKGVNAYMKANKGADLVWAVAQVRALTNKVMKDVYASHVDFCRDISREFPTEESRTSKFNDFFTSNYGATYRELSGSFTANKAKRDAFESLSKSIGRIDDVALLEKLQFLVAAQLETARANAARVDAVVGSTVQEGIFDDEVQDNVVALKAA